MHHEDIVNVMKFGFLLMKTLNFLLKIILNFDLIIIEGKPKKLN